MPTLETAVPAVDSLQLTQTRVIRAPRARVYDAWTNPELLMQWFGPANRHCPHATMDVRVGGGYRIDVMPNAPAPTTTPGAECESQLSTAQGRYTKVVPNELLQFTWSTTWNPEEETRVTVALKDVAGGTELTLVHENFRSEASRAGHSSGWAGSLDKLEALADGL